MVAARLRLLLFLVTAVFLFALWHQRASSRSSELDSIPQFGEGYYLFKAPPKLIESWKAHGLAEHFSPFEVELHGEMFSSPEIHKVDKNLKGIRYGEIAEVVSQNLSVIGNRTAFLETFHPSEQESQEEYIDKLRVRYLAVTSFQLNGVFRSGELVAAFLTLTGESSNKEVWVYKKLNGIWQRIYFDYASRGDLQLAGTLFLNGREIRRVR